MDQELWIKNIFKNKSLISIWIYWANNFLPFNGLYRKFNKKTSFSGFFSPLIYHYHLPKIPKLKKKWKTNKKNLLIFWKSNIPKLSHWKVSGVKHNIFKLCLHIKKMMKSNIARDSGVPNNTSSILCFFSTFVICSYYHIIKNYGKYLCWCLPL